MQPKQIFSLIALFVALALWGTVGVRPAEAADFPVAAPCGQAQLVTAYNSARTSPNPSDTVTFTNCTLPLTINMTTSGLSALNNGAGKTVIIDGGGQVTLSGDNTFRLIQVTAGRLELHGLILQGFNSGASSGGVLRVNAGTTAVIQNSSLINNTTTAAGAAVYAHTGATLNISGSFFRNNVSGTSGGAVRYDAGNGTVVNSTFVENSGVGGTNNGGALAFNNGTVTMNNVTLHNNTAGGAGNGIRVGTAATVNVNNSVFSGASNCSVSGGTLNVTNSYASAAGCTGFTQNANVSDFAPLTPAVPTAGTHPPALPLLNTNAAVNTASATCEAIDQRGVSRAGQNCDAGAVESVTPTAVTLSDLQLSPSVVPVALAVGMFLLLGLATAVRLAPARRR